MHFSSDDALWLNLDAPFCENDPVEPPGDDHAIALDLAFNLCAFTEHDGLLGNDVAFDVSVNAERPCDLQRALEGDTLIDEAHPLFPASLFASAPAASAANPAAQPVLPSVLRGMLAARCASATGDPSLPKAPGRVRPRCDSLRSCREWSDRVLADALHWQPSHGLCPYVPRRLPASGETPPSCAG